MKKQCLNCEYFRHGELSEDWDVEGGRFGTGVCYANPPVVSDVIIRAHFEAKRYYAGEERDAQQVWVDIDEHACEEFKVGEVDHQGPLQSGVRPVVWSTDICRHWVMKEVANP